MVQSEVDGGDAFFWGLDEGVFDVCEDHVDDLALLGCVSEAVEVAL